MLTIRCPQCNSTDLRSSCASGFGESLGKVFGIEQLRCKDCDHRFSRSIWDFTNILYARCPACYRQDLALWKPEQYHSPVGWKFLLAIGAKPRRCEACRRNFVSFRPAKAIYVRRKFVRGSGVTPSS